MQLLVGLLPLILRIAGLLLDKQQENKKAKEHFLKMIAALESNGMKSVALRESYRDQVEQIKNGGGE